jgi:hypothetical protein
MFPPTLATIYHSSSNWILYNLYSYIDAVKQSRNQSVSHFTGQSVVFVPVIQDKTNALFLELVTAEFVSYLFLQKL